MEYFFKGCVVRKSNDEKLFLILRIFKSPNAAAIKFAVTEVDARGVLVELTGKASKKSIFSSHVPIFIHSLKLAFSFRLCFHLILIFIEAPKVVAFSCNIFSQPKVLHLPEDAMNAYLEMFSAEIHKIVGMFENRFSFRLIFFLNYENMILFYITFYLYCDFLSHKNR